MNRRQFLGAAGAAAALSVLPGGVAEALARPVDRSSPRKHQLTKVGCQRYPPTAESFRYYARHGVRHYAASPPGKFQDWTVEGLIKFRELVESYGITLEMAQLGFSPYVMLGKSPERDREIELMCQTIEKVSRAGIHGIKYNLTPRYPLRTESVPGRGGVMYPAYDYEKLTKDSLVIPTGPLPDDALWENVTYFLERVMPVAKQYRVRMACHPEDTPLPKGGFRGVGQILGTVAGMKRFVSIAENDYHGFNFCQGTVAEMLENPGKEIYEVIRYFGKRKKIFMVHFRNIKGTRGKFEEVYPDEGDVDMLQAMRVYQEVGYEHMILPDHLPLHPEDPEQKQGFAFAYGYIRGLMQAVNAEK